ncbi:hypothetical protein BGW41_002434 [Actinomortierella wolfii]|nr:hypothetical protein BGW41_002434 [Actinomortierella wolfii]
MDRHPQIPAFAHIPASPSSTDAGEDDIPSPSSPGLRTHLGQKLRDLVASGLVDFRQHVDVSSLRHVLNLGNPSDMLQPPEVEVHGYGGQLQRRSIVYRPLLSSPSETTVLQRTPRSDTFNSNNEDRQREERAVPMDGQPQVMVHPVDDVFTPMELNLDEALHQLHLLDMEEQWRERDTELWQFQALEDGHALQQLGAEAPSVASTEISVPFDGEVSTVTPHGGEPASVWTSNEPSTATSTFSKGTEGTNDIDDEQYQEMERQHAEARAAYQRAQLLIRILSSGQFQFLETLLVPWWPATQIFTICQQLEKWSRMAVMTQEAKNGPSNSLGTSNSLSTGKWRRRWTNELARKSCGYMMDRSSNGNCRYTHQPYLESNDMPVQRPSMTSITSPSFQQSTPSFPLASLRAFRLLSGGELKDYEVKCLGASALILSGYATVICAPSKAPSLSERLADTTSHEMQMQQVQNLISYFGHVELISHQEQQPHHQHQRTTSPMVCVSNMAYNTTKAVFEYCNICGVQYLNLEGSF